MKATRVRDHLPPTSAEFKKGGAISALPHMAYGIVLN
jgi:hypothetical protein